MFCYVLLMLLMNLQITLRNLLVIYVSVTQSTLNDSNFLTRMLY